MRRNETITWATRPRVGGAITAAMLGVLLAGCGSQAVSTNDPAGGGGSTAAYLEEAERITEEATAGLIYAPTNEFTAAEDLEPMTDWLGPTAAPHVPGGKTIAIVSCGATVCNETAEAGADIAREAGFDAELVNINGTADIANLNQAMSSAIALGPDAIVGVCITATQVADKLEQAADAGILTVSTCDPTPTGGVGQFAAAADYANGLSAELLGWGIVANTDGRADVVAIRDEAFPAVVRKIDNLVEVIEGCGSCRVKAETWQITDAANSAKAANILTGIINANPEMNTLVLPYSVGIQSAVQAVASSGRDIKIYADDLDAVNQQMLDDGQIEMVSSVDPQLAMYQCIDQVIRGLGGEPYVEPEGLPYLAHLYTRENLPSTGVGAFLEYVDYADVYADLWALR